MLSIGALLGEASWAMSNQVLRLHDGSWVAVKTDANSYVAGQVITGQVIASIMNPVVCDNVSVIIELEENVYWEAESSHTYSEGTGEHRKTRTVWEHYVRSFLGTVFRDVVRVAALPSILPPGLWQYGFTYAIPPSVPGVVKFRRMEASGDPSWRQMGRQREVRAEVNFVLKAVLQQRGVFMNELRSAQELTVNPFFDWAKMQPARASAAGRVLTCCCIPRGSVILNSTHDKAAYQCGETMNASVHVQNDSSVAMRKMSSKLVRTVILSDATGATHRVTDVLCRADFPGLEQKATAERAMPLTLASPSGFLPTIAAPHVKVFYEFVVTMDIPWAPDVR